MAQTYANQPVVKAQIDYGGWFILLAAQLAILLA